MENKELKDAPERYVCTKVALLLKQKGFRTCCFMSYFPDTFDLDFRMSKNYDGENIAAPTQQMAQAWIRLNFNIHIVVERYDNGIYTYKIVEYNDTSVRTLHDIFLDRSATVYSWSDAGDCIDAALEDVLTNYIPDYNETIAS